MVPCVEDVRRILTPDAALEILNDIGFRGNTSKANLTSKDQVLQKAMFFQMLIFKNTLFCVYRTEWE